MLKQLDMSEEKEKDPRGRKPLPEKELRAVLPVYAKVKNHKKILKKIKPIIKKMDV